LYIQDLRQLQTWVDHLIVQVQVTGNCGLVSLGLGTAVGPVEGGGGGSTVLALASLLQCLGAITVEVAAGTGVELLAQQISVRSLPTRISECSRRSGHVSKRVGRHSMFEGLEGHHRPVMVGDLPELACQQLPGFSL
jgi:hypothetical protein